MGKLDKLAKTSTGLSKKEEIAKVNMAIDTQSSDAIFRQLPLDEIEFNPENDYGCNDTTESIQTLADDIARNNLLHNIVVSRNNDSNSYLLISGERRVKALRLLQGNPEANRNGKWDTVQAKIYNNLTKRQAMIMLDSANLQTRGGVGDETQMRKGLNRYIDNLKAEYEISEAAALELAKEISASGNRTVENNRSIELRFSNEMKSLIDDGTLSKKWSIAMLDFNENEQQCVVTILTTTKALFANDEHEIANNLRAVTKKIVDASDLPFDVRAGELQQLANKCRETLDNQLSAPSNIPMTGNPKNLRYVKNSRQEYVAKIEDISDKINRLCAKKKLEAMASFDICAGESDDKIIDKLQASISMMENMKQKLETAIECNRILSTGILASGDKASPDDMADAKRKKRDLYR